MFSDLFYFSDCWLVWFSLVGWYELNDIYTTSWFHLISLSDYRLFEREIFPQNFPLGASAESRVGCIGNSVVFIYVYLCIYRVNKIMCMIVTNLYFQNTHLYGAYIEYDIMIHTLW